MAKCTAKEILTIAAKQIGIKEKPANSNNVKYNTWYYGKPVYGSSAYPWCCAFVNWLFYKAGAMELFNGGTKTAYCPTVVNWAKRKGLWLGRTKNPKPGDLVLFAGKDGVACHIGIVEKKISDTRVQTIEGNTSTGNGGSQSNGGMVARRTRDYGKTGSSWYILGFVRPEYKTFNSTADTTPPKKKPATSSYSAVITAKSGLNMRKSASTSAAVLTAIPYNTTIKITTEKGSWGKTTYDGKTGWVYLQYVKKK